MRQDQCKSPFWIMSITSLIRLRLAKNKRTSNQINKQRLKHKTDYENLLLLQKIQNVRPSREIVDSFRSLSLQR